MRLLEEFAYYNPRTKDKRLWRYAKDEHPSWRAAPRSATRIDGQYADPENAAKEAELESLLNQQFEDPVNKFLFQMSDPNFVPTDVQRRQLTFYVTLLFNRSEARRNASSHLLKGGRSRLRDVCEK